MFFNYRNRGSNYAGMSVDKKRNRGVKLIRNLITWVGSDWSGIKKSA